MLDSRVVIFSGHYGSGKTNLAVNWAINARTRHERVVLADLDIVNPYFRTSDSSSALSKSGVTLVTSQFAGSNVDLPSIPSGAESIFDDRSVYGVVDVGGDDRGALALGRYADKIRREHADVLLVVNMYRPETSNISGAMDILREIEAASHSSFTGIVNNSNLGNITTDIDVLNSVAFVNKLSIASNLPVMFTSVQRSVYASLGNKIANLFPIDITIKSEWKL